MESTKIEIRDIKKIFKVGNQDVDVLKGISFDINQGDFLIVFGPSGCGKSTLLHIILGLEPPTSGNIDFFGFSMYNPSYVEDDRSIFRRKNVGMVYQQANWVKSLNVKENVAFPLTLLGYSKTDAYTKVIQVLKSVEMDGWADYWPTELSSGQQQRIALARSLINDPKVIVADEPTGNLDYRSGQEMMELLSNLSKQHNKTVIMVTHDLEYLKYANKVAQMLDGNLVGVFEGADKDKIASSVASKRGVVGKSDAANTSKVTDKKDESSVSDSLGNTSSEENTQNIDSKQDKEYYDLYKSPNDLKEDVKVKDVKKSNKFIMNNKKVAVEKKV